MSEVERALLIILSGALAVFLVLGIVAMVLFIQLLKSLKRVGQKAEAVGDIIEDSARSIVSMKALSSIVSLFTNRMRSKRR